MATIRDTIIAACKAADVVGGKVWRVGGLPQKPPKPPYVTVLHPVAGAPLIGGDARITARSAEGQVSLWELENDEDESRRIGLEQALDGLSLGDTDEGNALRLRWLSTVTLNDPDPKILQRVLLLRIDYVT